MLRLRRLTARQMLRVLHGFGFEVVATKGSYAKLGRVLPSGERQVLTVSLHRELGAGTLRAVVRQVALFVPESELRSVFFTD